MNQFTTEIIQTLVKGGDISEIFRQHLESAVNTLLQTELTAFLDYEKYDRVGFNSGNSRNGSYKRTLHTEYGDLSLVIPRDRNGEFNQQTIAPYKRSNDTLESFVIHLFQKGVTTREISDLIEKMYGHHYTPQTISNMTKAVGIHVEAFKNRTLQNRYVCVYLDATYIPVRRETVSKEAVYIAVGINEDGNKEVLSYMIAPTESAYNYKELLEDLKARGVQDVLLFISDGLKGMAESIFSVYPKAKYQQCLVHISRNIAHKVRITDREEVCHDFKAVYQATNKDEASKAVEMFVDKWKKSYPKVVASITSNEYLLTFYRFPESIRKSIYSTNLIEGLNKQIKRHTKRKEQFPNEESLERFLVSRFEVYNQQFGTNCHRGFNAAKSELLEMFNLNQ